MPAIPESTRSSILLRLLDHAEKNWPQLAKVQARYHGSFAYITGVLPGGEQIPLFRLRYGGSAHSFGFAIYSPARDRYDDAVLLTGLPIGSPQQALDTACTLHLAALGHEPESWPPTDLRCHPLSVGHLHRGPSGVRATAACWRDRRWVVNRGPSTRPAPGRAALLLVAADRAYRNQGSHFLQANCGRGVADNGA
jgi:hypothetical protein